MSDHLLREKENSFAKAASHFVTNFITRCISVVYRFSLWIIISTLLFTGWVLFYVSGHLGVDMDTGNILAPDLPFRIASKNYDKLFPQYQDTLLILVEGDIPEHTWDATKQLTNALEKNSLVKSIYAPESNDFFKRNGLIYLDLKDLDTVADNLAEAQPFLGKLTQDLTLNNFFGMLDDIISAKQKKETTLDLESIFSSINETIESTLKGQDHLLSWQDLMNRGSSLSKSGERQFIIVQPQMDYNQMLPAKDAIDVIRDVAKSLHLDPEHGVRIRLTGDVGLAHEELESALTGNTLAGILALIMTGTLLYIGLRSGAFALTILLGLVVGLILTAGFAAFYIGHLNIISTAFGVLYIGLSTEYDIQFCMRYQQLVNQGANRLRALKVTASETGIALILCAITTMIGFYSFIPTKFSGVSELGLIAGTGMVINLSLTLLLLPAILRYLPVKNIPNIYESKTQGKFDFIYSWPLQYRKQILLGGLILGLATLPFLLQVRFDYDPLNLRNPNSESVSTIRQLMKTETIPMWSAIVLASNAEEAQKISQRAKRIDSVDKVITAEDFVPDNQEEKLEIIDDLSLLVGPLLLDASIKPSADPDSRQVLSTLDIFLHTLDSYFKDPSPKDFLAIQRLEEDIQYLVSTIEQEDQATQKQTLLRLEHNLLGTLPENLSQLQNSLKAEAVTMDTLPSDLIDRWITADGTHRVEIFPTKDFNVDDLQSLRGFVNKIHEISPSATGPLVLQLRSGEAIVDALQHAFSYALFAIIVVLFLLLRSIKDVLLVLVPLALAGLLLSTAMATFHIYFNFANVVALPLLLGVGVDSGIYMVERVRQAPGDRNDLLRTSTSRALVFTTLTTMFSLGNLLLVSHPGMASMGLILTIGIVFTLLCTLILLPALLTSNSEKSTSLQ
ncbi:MMPL family transporter [Candidatus Nitrosacidococcus tergens]|uniref:Hopanoid biosynthesis associated RND transporter like protein HpnN n=1 Tax=Candidatus Nitrosacidococcus tergens TaxID=553981 RepID=A0A7G1Q8V6_9GAMM|nr:MMPL family transporter [Candidatus Nitrosacidococcus tergens]CAB1275438.1 Hopanoid biosynthesis associated RND transporter like protein HpnN [Candidatus Nitrosacidococcus tergens]